MLWGKLTVAEVAADGRDGARSDTERHGVRTLVLPALTSGPASERHGLPGTLSLGNALWMGVIKQPGWSGMDSGFRRVAAVKGRRQPALRRATPTDHAA